MIRKILLLGCLQFFILGNLHAATEPFLVTDIRIDGLQRVSAGSLFQAFPINIGDQIDEQTIVNATRSLFDTGFFNDIKIGRDRDVLVVTVVERPSVSSIQIDGNKAIKTEDLMDGLRQAGLSEGEIFQRVTLERMTQELSRQYVAQGRYGVKVETDVQAQPRNRVALSINITEGGPSSIKRINIVGNSVYSDDELLDLFELRRTNWRSFYRKDDQYSREKLTGDLERLRSQYLDRGYVNFSIESTQVSVTPDKENVYITVNIVEGQRYRVGEVNFAGDLVLDEEELRRFLVIKEGDWFSNATMTRSTEFITNRLGNEGYTFANVIGDPRTDDAEQRVNISIFIDPGKRAYVRRVNFAGNTKTKDEVLRREMRQMESAWASNANIELSKLRLERLGFFREVNVETPQVPGSEDLIDVNYSVEEQPSGSITASLGFAQNQGLVLGVGVSQNNFLGTGNRVSLGANKSRWRTNYQLSYLNPYYTPDGVSRGFNVFFRELDFNEDNIASYITNSYGGGVTFGYPLSETQFVALNLGYENTDITPGFYVVKEIEEFVNQEGRQYNEFLATISWRQSRLNRGVFATRGTAQQLALELAVPGSDLTFFKLSYDGEAYLPLTDSLTLRFSTELGYGDAYGDTSSLPFYKHYFAGGLGSIRGFERNTLGPRSTPNDNDPNRKPYPFGGNVLIRGGIDLLFPLPFIKDTRSMRSAFFVDVGNVFNSNCPPVSQRCLDVDFGELRYSVGFGITWLSAFGPLTFAVAQSFNEGEFEDTEFFDFSVGTTF